MLTRSATQSFDFALTATGRVDRVVIINDVSAIRGGATGVAIASLKLLRERGVAVTYFTGDDGSEADPALGSAELVALGGVHIRDAAAFTSVRAGLYNRRAADALARWIAKNDTPYTAYHLHGWSKILSPAIFLPLKNVASRLIVSAHDFFLVCPNGGYFDFRAQEPCNLRPMGLSCLTRSCDRRNYAHKLWRVARQGVRQTLFDFAKQGATVLAVHEGMLPLLAFGGIPPNRLQVLRNPVTPWRANRVRAESKRNFLFVGRLETDKGATLFAQAARAADVPACFVGSGPLAGEIAKINPSAKLLGWKERDEIAEIAANSRVLVMPSQYREPFGLVALEGLMSGLPLIATPQSMIANEVVASGMALACDPHDIAAFSATLKRLDADDDLVASMSNTAYAQAHRFALSPAEWITRLYGLYAGATQKAGAEQPHTHIPASATALAPQWISPVP